MEHSDKDRVYDFSQYSQAALHRERTSAVGIGGTPCRDPRLAAYARPVRLPTQPLARTMHLPQ